MYAKVESINPRTCNHQSITTTKNKTAMETPAIRITEIEGRGRSITSLRPLKAGEIILRDSPLLLYSALPFQSNHHYCSNCFTTIPLLHQPLTCPTCTSQFCSPTCQSTALHTQWFCKTLTLLIQYLLTNHLHLDIQIQLRFLVSAYNLAIVSKSKFQTLLSLHGAHSHSDSSFIHSIISSVCPPLPTELGLGFSNELTSALLAKDKLNAFGLMEPFLGGEDRSVRAYGIYPMASFFNHDCLPNACRFDYLDSVKTPEITIRMIHDIPEGREVCLSYFPVNLKYSERQKRLREDYGFVCDCDRCKVEAGWSESDEDVLGMEDDEGIENATMDEDVDVDEQMEAEEMNGEADFPHAYFFLNYMCDRTNCWGTLAPLPPSGAATSGVMECNVCGSFKNRDQV